MTISSGCFADTVKTVCGGRQRLRTSSRKPSHLCDPWRQIDGIVREIFEVILTLVGTQYHLLDFVPFREEAAGIFVKHSTRASRFIYIQLFSCDLWSGEVRSLQAHQWLGAGLTL